MLFWWEVESRWGRKPVMRPGNLDGEGTLPGPSTRGQPLDTEKKRAPPSDSLPRCHTFQLPTVHLTSVATGGWGHRLRRQQHAVGFASLGPGKAEKRSGCGGGTIQDLSPSWCSKLFPTTFSHRLYSLVNPDPRSKQTPREGGVKGSGPGAGEAISFFQEGGGAADTDGSEENTVSGHPQPH